MDEMQSICQQWQLAKEREANAKMERIGLEARLVTLAGIPNTQEGVATVKPNGFIVKITGNIARKVDGDLLQEIAKEQGLESHLKSLFRWTPEINMRNWKAADVTITKPLAAAITSTPQKQSVKITPVEVV